MRKFAIKYLKHTAKEKRQQRINLENQLKELERNLDEDNLSKYNSPKNELDVTYKHIADVIRIRSKCGWYEHDKKSTNFFKKIRKKTRISKYNKKPVADDKEITDETRILEHIREFYETLFKTQEQKTAIGKESFSFFFNLNFFSSFSLPIEL